MVFRWFLVKERLHSETFSAKKWLVPLYIVAHVPGARRRGHRGIHTTHFDPRQYSTAGDTPADRRLWLVVTVLCTRRSLWYFLSAYYLGAHLARCSSCRLLVRPPGGRQQQANFPLLRGTFLRSQIPLRCWFTLLYAFGWYVAVMCRSDAEWRRGATSQILYPSVFGSIDRLSVPVHYIPGVLGSHTHLYIILLWCRSLVPSTKTRKTILKTYIDRRSVHVFNVALSSRTFTDQHSTTIVVGT